MIASLVGCLMVSQVKVQDFGVVVKEVDRLLIASPS
jgi:hypothetical protein